MENIQEREREIVNINLYTIFNLTKQNNEFTLINNHILTQTIQLVYLKLMKHIYF